MQAGVHVLAGEMLVKTAPYHQDMSHIAQIKASPYVWKYATAFYVACKQDRMYADHDVAVIARMCANKLAFMVTCFVVLFQGMNNPKRHGKV